MKKDISYPVFVKYLTRSTFLFLVAPYLIFFYGWLHWWLAVLMTIVCLIPIVWDWNRPHESASQQDGNATITIWQIVVICGGALFLTLISGIGGWGFQNTDWDKHNTLLRDLVQLPWPLVYQIDNFQLPFNYYFAYYLPAALIGKVFGWASANHALMVESWIGSSLTLLWGFALLKRSWWKAAVIIGCFAGLDIVGYLLTMPVMPKFIGKPLDILGIEWWSIAWNYPSFNRVLFWMPNQGFAGWLITSLILYEIFNRDRRYTIWYLGLTTFWSPFITIGLIPLVLANWISERDTLFAWIRKYALPNLCGALLGGLIGFMYLAKMYPLPPQIGGEILSEFIFTLAEGRSDIIAGLVVLLALFWLLEVGIYGILTWKLLDKDDKQSRILLAIGLVILILLPFYQYGYYNDLLHKASIPSIFTLSIILGRTVLNQNVKRRMQVALTILLGIGFLTSFINIGIQVNGIVKNGALWHLPASSEVDTLLELQEKEKARAFEIGDFEFTSFISQYISSGEAPFFQWFVKK